MTLSLVYRLKRRRLVSLMVLAFGLVVLAAVFGPSYEPAGPVWAERVGSGAMAVLKSPASGYTLSYSDAGPWRESEPFSGEVRATLGGEKLVVFHGRDYTTYAPGDGDKPPRRERWDAFPHHWAVAAAAGGGAPAVFGLLDGRTIAAARLKSETWEQVPGDLRRAGEVRDLVAAGGAGETWLWWREDAGVFGAPLGAGGWGEPRAFEVAPDARLAAASVKDVPVLFAFRDLRRRRIAVRAYPAGGAPWDATVANPARFLAAVESVSVADGEEPALFAARGVSVGRAALVPGQETSLDGLVHTTFRYRPGVLPWATAFAFAGLGMIGIGVSLLFERRRVDEPELVEQVKLLTTVAPLVLRGVAASIDIFPFWLLAGWLAQQGPVWGLLGILACHGASCGYHAAFETLWNQTPGKMLTGIAVRRLDGAPAEWWRIAVRNTVRFFELPLFLVWMVCLISTKRLQRLGDVAAGTMVVRVARPPEPAEEEGA